MDTSQYRYAAMSNLVLRSDRRRGGDAEPTGEPETLVGRINPRQMGDRVRGSGAARPPANLVASQRLDQTLNVEDLAAAGDGRARKRKAGRRAGGPRNVSSVLDATQDLEGLSYRPRTQETSQAYEHILAFIQSVLGDQTHEILRSAADVVLEVLKNEDLKDSERKAQIDDIVGATLTNEQFAQLVTLGKRITDYAAPGEDQDGQMGAQDQAVAVVVDEEEEQDDYNDLYAESDPDLDERPSDEEDDAGGRDGDVAAADVHMDGQSGSIGDAISRSKANSEADVVHPRDIDAFWLQRTINSIYNDAHVTQEKTTEAMNILAEASGNPEASLGQVENDLMELFDFENFDIVRKLTKNLDSIVWCTRLSRCENDEQRKSITKQMESLGLSGILQAITSDDASAPKPQTEDSADDHGKMDIDDKAGGHGAKAAASVAPGSTMPPPKQLVDLENFVFEQGSHLMSNKKVSLPQGTKKYDHKGYQEIEVPAMPRATLAAGEKLVEISSMPEWTHKAFKGANTLNRIQSKLYPRAFGEDQNLLLCAPTGAGKTNVAMLCILNEIAKYRDPETGDIDLENFKIVYIAPLKALVQEMVGNFSDRLTPYGIQVSELTGDRQLTKQAISETQIIVTTPEKWDVITRKATDLSYTNLVRLIIIDEIHLLHDERGPVLESIVARTLRKQLQTSEHVRLVGLSATLPNYVDVAAFLRVDPKQGLFYFDSSFRPCPLQQNFLGVTEKRAIKRLQAMNDACYDKVMQQAGKNQMLIFVHSRKETAKTAKFIRDKALEEETIGRILRPDAAIREILQSEAEQSKDGNLKDLLPYGIAIHHAGMTRADRQVAEDLFAEGAVQILVSTATLAWGVNLPAHTVIIKGTQVYSPEKGQWTELSPQDVLQMLGRAGRPQYDTYGEGIIITTQQELQYYLSLLNQQLPIESQLFSKLADNMNAEIVLGTIRNRDEAVQWLGYTYLYVRMLRSPGLYSVGAEYGDDIYLVQKRVDLVHSAATVLARCGLIVYDKKSGRMISTDQGRVASHYYISHYSMATYNDELSVHMSFIELFRLFCRSDEFKYIPVRQEEKIELAKLLERVPIPIRETVDEPSAKINALLQSYISRQKLEGFALMADMVYVTQSAGRILRALFEITLRRGWARVTRLLLDMCKMVDRRMWTTMSPLRQFPQIPPRVIRSLERKDLAFSRYFDLQPQEMGELVGIPAEGRLVHQCVNSFPRVELQANVQPITGSVLRIELSITPVFEWMDEVHGTAEQFWIMAEDGDGENILFQDVFVLRRRYAKQEHIVEFTLPIGSPQPPNYFISLISDRWIGSETKLPVSFQHLILPQKFPAPTPLLDLQPLPIQALRNSDIIGIYSAEGISHFNKYQTQLFNALYTTDESLFFGAPVGSGKTICAELALLRHWTNGEEGRALYVAPMQATVDEKLEEWQKFKDLGDGKTIIKLTGETSEDIKRLAAADVVLATPQQWDNLSRRWRQRKNVQTIDLYICDDVHDIGGHKGPVYETILSRIRYAAAQLERKVRIVALSVSLANPKDLSEWIGASTQNIYNFSPKHQVLERHVQSFQIPHFPSLMLAMVKSVYLALREMAPNMPSIVFTPSRQIAQQTAEELVTLIGADDQDEEFLAADAEDMQKFAVKLSDPILRDCIMSGVGYIHEGTPPRDLGILKQLWHSGAFRVLLMPRELTFEMDVQAFMVIIMGTQFFDGKEHRYIDYPVAEILEMMGHARSAIEGMPPKSVLMTNTVKKEYYKKFLDEPLPMESHLHLELHDAFVAEIASQTIENKQDAVDWLTWTYMYRRLVANPSFYALQDTTHESISEYLSDLVETVLQDLSEAKIITLDEETDSCFPLNQAMIASYYNIMYITMQTFTLSLGERTKMKGLMEIVSSAAEFDAIPIRRHENIVLQRIYDRMPVKLAQPDFDSPQSKVFILLAAHFSRFGLPIDLELDQKIVLRKVMSLFSACVDILSSEGFLQACIRPIEMSQMTVQAMWDRDPLLRQIPHFTAATIQRAKEMGVSEVYDFQELEDDRREELLQGFSSKQMNDIATFVNKYPMIDMEYELDVDDLATHNPTIATVILDRGLDEDEEVDTRVVAPFFPMEKSEQWWIIISDETSLLAIKKVTIQRRLATKLEFVPVTPGRHEFKITCLSDSYMGVDSEKTFTATVAQGEPPAEMDED